MSNLGFELWWAGGTTTLLTTQPQVEPCLPPIVICSVKEEMIIRHYLNNSMACGGLRGASLYQHLEADASSSSPLGWQPHTEHLTTLLDKIIYDIPPSFCC
jgi:hypothetical protein